MEDSQTVDIPEGTIRDARRPLRDFLVVPTVLTVIGLVSIFLLAPIASGPEAIGHVRASLDSQEGAVTTMAASATGLSIALGAIPGDAATGVADQLAELSSYFIVIIGAIVLQKLLFAAVGYIAFTYIIPIACGLGIAAAVFKNAVFRTMAIKLAIFGVVIFIAIPASTTVSSMMNQAYADSAHKTTAEATSHAKKAEKAAEKQASAEDANENLIEKAKDAASDTVDSIRGALTNAAEAVKDVKDDAVASLNAFMEQIALLIVTTCVIPVLTIVLFAWVIRILFGFDIRIGQLGHTIQARTSRSIRSTRRGLKRQTQ